MAESGTSLRRMARAAARQPLTLWSSVAAAATLAVLVAGGFDPQDTAVDVEPLTVGEAVDVGPFDITIQRMRVIDELPGVSEGNDDTRVLAVVATVAANGPQTQYGYLLGESVTLDGVEGIGADAYELPTDFPTPPAEDEDESPTAGLTPADQTFVMEDGTRLDAIQPGLTYEVALLWEQNTKEPAPTTARLVLVGHTLRESSIDRSEEWFDPLPLMAGDIEITEAEPTPDGDSESGSS